ncbi:MAG: hypothetical protein U9N49_00565 [Campylobacterota bacterium]|nr:hypothetical protein [Campylobacterota bacterium]
MNHAIERYFLIIGILSLGLFELSVFYKMFHPNVSEHYRLYYIERKLLSWSNGEGLLYKKSSTVNSTNIVRLLSRKGWTKSQKGFFVTHGDVSHIYFQIEKKINYEGVLYLDFSMLNKQNVAIYINNQQLMNKVCDKGRSRIKLKFNPIIFNSDHTFNTITLKFPNIPTANNKFAMVLGALTMR